MNIERAKGKKSSSSRDRLKKLRALKKRRAVRENTSEEPTKRSNRASRGDRVSVSDEARDGDGDGNVVTRTVSGLADAFGFGDDSKRAEDKDDDATIAVFDSFRDADKDGESTHGELVEGVIQQEGGFDDEDVQRYQISGGGSLSDLRDGLGEGGDEAEDAFHKYIEDRYTGLLDNTREGLEEILDDKDSKIKTVNQSQSVAEGRIARDLWEEAKDDDKFRADLTGALGLDSDASDRELAQALADGIGDSVANNDAIAESQEKYDEVSRRASDAGITHVVTSGNLGRFADEWERLGVETDRQFYDSALANRHKLVVAATDDHGTRTQTDDSGAVFNSPDANADVSANGVDIEIRTQDGEMETASGTSFAAPMVAALVAQIKAENPNLSPSEIERLLERNADDLMGSRQDVGAGTINENDSLADAA